VRGALCAGRHSFQFLDDFLLGRKAPFVVLREEALLVDRDVEDPAAATHELTFDAELFLDLSRQTGGSGEIVSDAAIIDPNLHDIS